ncbi:YeeE/YedE family protein [Ketobacter sp. MCCC 1A13808]|uniref:DUF6691 family protein n=1 Tax=Ketobacter sp. MCCC 1A13808 TaxID=2602738 RepID=UPI000F174B94|nr:DUF6691 family protein [Ketobacter sp. MCCC 1A13808]MVF11592.1 YeeE/YedE family protein [Ketobacter sp. MCCC 1A13808]RLP55206.1 MAG: YeeE/YedE family protein [Ketobacter sp.]
MSNALGSNLLSGSKWTLISAGLSGLIFGLGLLLSGMANPAKVLAFLDLAGRWDPSLMLVMAGAVGISLAAFTLAKGRSRSLLGEPLRLPTLRQLDKRLILGSLGFGVGWGLAGFCPGPALVAFATGTPKAVVFFIAMLTGMGLFEILGRFGAGPRH